MIPLRKTCLRDVLREPWIAFTVIVLVCVGLPLAWTLAVGAVPANDDWSYAKAALALHDGHGVELQGFNQMFLIGQLVLTQPVLSVADGRFTGLLVFDAVAATLWLAVALATTRPLIGPSRAVLLTLALGVCPVAVLLAPSYMTDLPAAASAAIALLLGIRAVEKESTWRLVLAALATTVAFTVREQGAVVLVALAVAVWARWTRLRRQFRWTSVGLGAVCVPAWVALEQLRHGVPHGDPPPFGLHSLHPIALPDSLARGVFTIALMLSPLVVIAVAGLGRGGRRTGAAIVTITVAVAAVLVVTGPGSSVLLGNYLERDGAYANALVGSPPPTFGPIAWTVVQVLAAASTAGLCVVLAVRRPRHAMSLERLRAVPVRALMLYTYAGVLAVVSVLLAALGEHQYDRYVLPLLPAIGAVLLNRPASAAAPARTGTRSRTALASLAVLCGGLTAAVSVVLVSSTAARDHAVWRAADRLSSTGVAPTLINAGSAWDGWHATTALARNEKPDVDQYTGDLWAQRFPRSADCYVVSLSTLPDHDWRLLNVSGGAPYGTMFGSVHVFTYRRIGGRLLGGASCRPAPGPG